MAFLSACYSDCAIPKNLAITGELKTEKKKFRLKLNPSQKNITDRQIFVPNVESILKHIILFATK